jgi:lantibiotic biosynthesis protein
VPEPAAELGLSRSYRASDFFVVRSPLLPVERLLDWLGPAAEGAAGARLDFALERSRSIARLRDQFGDPALESALFFASPDTHEALCKLSADSQTPPKLVRSLLRYFVRATGRETPFGLFAGNSVGRFERNDCFELPARDQYRSQTRISISSLAQWMAALGARHDVRDEIPHEPNSSLALVQNDYRLAIDERAAVRGRTFVTSLLTEVTRTPALDRALALARDGRTPRDIANAMVEPGFDFLELLDFCRSLCDAKILVPVWLPTATGLDAARAHLLQMEGHARLDEVRTRLGDILRALEEGDRAGLLNLGSSYRLARQRLLAEPFSIDTPQPLQTELVKPAPSLTMSEGLAGRFLAAAELLQRTGRPRTESALARFRDRFLARYDRRLVPLVEALDGDLGVGFDGSEARVAEALLSGLPFAAPAPDSSRWGSHDYVRLRVLEAALTRGAREVALDGALLAQFPRDESAFPVCESFAVVARLARGDDGQTVIVTPELLAPSALALFGRFCEADPDLHAAVARQAELEQQLSGETILADVAYFPSDESANVVTRPVLRHYEILCGGRSGAPADRQLPLSDLLVGVEGERVQLYSVRLGKRVAIRLGTAHNYEQAQLPTIYRFLGTLQCQAGDSLVSSWSWGALEGSPFLPRVVSEGVVLSLARWQIPEPEWRPLFAARPEDLLARARELRAARDLPRFVTRSEFDRRLTVDLENQLSVEELVHEARQQRELMLEELFPAPDRQVLRGPEGSYTAQVVLPFVRREPRPAEPVPSALADPIRAARRCRVPGSEWLYARIYAGNSRQAAILRALRAGVIEPSLGSAAKLWFYLPFADPEPHVRIRFQGEPSKLRGIVLSRLERTLEPMLQTGAVFRLELGSYEPEFERYGGPLGVELAEQLFFVDSEAASRLVGLAEEDPELGWQLALLGIDRLLTDCGAGLEQRAEIAQSASEDYGLEMGATTATWKAIGDKYRKYAPTLSRWLWEQPEADETIAKARRILATRSARLAPIWADIERATRNGSMKTPEGEHLPRTFAHLHALRVLGAGGRAHELVLYEFLKRQYAAQRSIKDTRHDLPLRSA